jgi:putative DNA primase/helicase
MTLDSDTITLARSVRLEDELGRRGIKLRGKVEREGPCPICGGHDRFSVHVRKQLFVCRGFGGSDVIAMVMHLDGCDFPTAVRTLTGIEPGRPAPKPDPVRAAEAQKKAERAEIDQLIDEQERFFKAMKIWQDVAPIENTPVEVYLRTYRKLDIPAGISGAVLRFHPACPFGTTTYPSMIALVRGVVTNDLQGVHRTALNPDGTPVKVNGKTARLALGSTKNGAIKLTDDADVSTGLFVGEGIETTMAGMMSPRWWRPAWALLYADNIASLPVLPGIECLSILVDHDRQDKHGRRAGEAAARECAERWTAAGRDVTELIPTIEGEDIADVASQR